MNETLRIAEDYEYWVRLSYSYCFASLNRPQACYVLHGSNISSDEPDSSAAGNAPGLLAACRIMLDYPLLEKNAYKIDQEKNAETLFSWGYRCRKQGLLGQALRLHLSSFRFGKRRENVMSVIKLFLVSLFPTLESGG